MVVAFDGKLRRVWRLGGIAPTERRTEDWSEAIDPNKSAAGELRDPPCAIEVESLTRPRKPLWTRRRLGK